MYNYYLYILNFSVNAFLLVNPFYILYCSVSKVFFYFLLTNIKYIYYEHVGKYPFLVAVLRCS